MTETAPAALKWLGSQVGPELGGTLSGIIGDSAHKRGYHRGRNYVYSTDYSRQLAEDKNGSGENACAIDMSFSASKMKLYTGRLKAAADANDPRLKYFREFYGTLNGTTVYGRIHKGSADATWEASTSDTSHLWHIHVSVLRQYAENMTVMQGLLDILMGVPLVVAFGSRLLQENMSGPDVKELQTRLNLTGARLTVDGDFGPATTSAVKTFQAAQKLTADGIVGSTTANALKNTTTLGDEDMDARQEALVIKGSVTTENALYYWLRTLADQDDATIKSVWGKGGAVPGLKQIADLVTAMRTDLVARDEAEKVRDAGTTAAIKALTDLVNKLSTGGGTVDSAAIVNAVQTAAADTKTKVASLEAQVTDLKTKLAAAAQAEAIAFGATTSVQVTPR